MSKIFDSPLDLHHDVQSAEYRRRLDAWVGDAAAEPPGPGPRRRGRGRVAHWLRKLGLRRDNGRGSGAETGHDLLITPEGGGDLAEPFRILRSSLLGFGGGRVMITSALDQEGKSLCAANLAISLSLPKDSQVVLVDLDLRRPTVHELFAVEGSPGVVDCLLGEASWPDCLRPTAYPNLKILPAGSPSHMAPELLASAALRAMMEEIRAFAATRFVLLDTPPVLLTADPRTLVDESDRVILVVRAEATPRSAFLEAIEALGTEKLLGVVFNQARQQASGYYQYGRRGYGGAYGIRERP